MSQENVEVVVGVLKSVNARDWAAVEDAHGEDVVLALHGALQSLAGGEVLGKKAVVGWFGDWFRTFDRDYHFEIAETRDRGDMVFIVATHHARGCASGTPVTYRAAWISTVRDRKIVRSELYPDEAEALEAVGLTE